jgi:hypothetical protein
MSRLFAAIISCYHKHTNHERKGKKRMATRANNRGLESVGQIIHKEKNQKKNNKTKGQHDKLKKYGNEGTMSMDKLTTSDYQIKREARYMKNIHIDQAYERLLMMKCITNPNYKAWWCGVMHKLGVAFVMVQADQACKNAKDRDNPAGLFHFLINKELNKNIDPYMPRFNR